MRLIIKHGSLVAPTGQWICAFNPIPKNYWEAIEMFVDDQWVRWDGMTLIERYVEICLECNND